MDAIVIKEYLTDISQLSVSKNVAIPSNLKNDEVLIRVEATALNFFDILQSQNKYQTQPKLPFVLGFEFAGTVVKSSLESGLQVGDRVFGGHQGSFAEFIAVPASQLLPIPDELSFEEASTLFITAPTSYLAVVERGRLKRGETCLVHAGAGGVGLMAIQIAKAKGGIVIATASTREKLEICQKYGADFVVNYKESDWIDQVKKITKGKGCDVIFDPVGLIDLSLKVVAFNGRILIIGFAAGKIEEIKANKILLKSASIVGVFWGGATIKDPQVVPRVWFSLMEMLRAKEIIPVVNGRVYDGLSHVKEGLIALGSRETYGKVVVRVRKGNAPKL